MKRENNNSTRAAYNGPSKKLALQWLGEALCLVPSSVVADSLDLRTCQLIVTLQFYQHAQKNNNKQTIVQTAKE